MTKKQPDYDVTEFNQNLQQQEIAQIRQGIATNQLTKIIANKKNTETDPFTGITIYQKNEDFQLNFLNLDFDKYRGYTATTSLLLDILIYQMTKKGANTPQITLTVKEFMELRGLKNERKARDQIIKDLEVLFSSRVSFKDNTSGKYKNYLDIHLLDAKGIVKNGVISVTLGLNFYMIVKNYPLMLMPINIFSLDLNKNPHAYYICRRISEHLRMNLGKPNENIISVQSLVEACPELPDYETVSQSGRQVNQRIIQPFVRDLEELEKFFNWQFCNSKQQPLKDEQLAIEDYETFINLYVYVKWKNNVNIPRLDKNLEKLPLVMSIEEKSEKIIEKTAPSDEQSKK